MERCLRSISRRRGIAEKCGDGHAEDGATGISCRHADRRAGCGGSGMHVDVSATRDTEIDTASVEAAADEALILAAKRRGTWARLRRQRVAMACLVLILLFVLAAILAPWLAPHDPDFQF